jgi:hypothetical protein
MPGVGVGIMLAVAFYDAADPLLAIIDSNSGLDRGVGLAISWSCSAESTLDFRPGCRPNGSGGFIFGIRRSIC